MDESLVGRFVYRLAKVTAIFGGAVLVVITLTTIVSIIGRALIRFGFGAIPGDFEIVQAGMLFAIFAFLPWCHLERGHAIVSIVTDSLPVRLNAIVEFIWDVAMLLASSFIAWRLAVGLLDKLGNRESTFILRLPVWLIYSAGAIGAAIFVIVALYCAVRSGRNALFDRPTRPTSEVAE
jgi:TRAP-type C4-dicarboxylate transport system permease small subunit